MTDEQTILLANVIGKLKKKKEKITSGYRPAV